MKTTTIKKLAAVSAAIICLASCGKVDDITPKEGKATLTTTTTAAVEETTTAETEAEPNELEENADESSKEDEKSEETKKNDKKKVTTAKKAETTTAKKAATTSAAKKAAATTTTKKAAATTTTKATTTTTTTTTTTSATTPAPEPEPEPQVQIIDSDFTRSLHVIYNGFEFAIGDNINNVAPVIGEIRPSGDGEMCGANHIPKMYYFNGMTISTYNDRIFQIVIDSATSNGANIGLTAGPGLGSTLEDVTNAYGTDNGYRYENQDPLFFISYSADGQYVQFGADEYGIYTITIDCEALK